MNQEQARKLLGGYATNSLTDAERKALFEAALDDQELFDALQQEEALKELLADPVSRNQVQKALAQAPVSGVTGAAWWSRGWVWGGVAGAVAAAVMIVAVTRSNETPKEMARVQSAPQVSAQDSIAIPTPPQARSNQPEPAPRKALRASRVDQPTNGRTSTGAVTNAVTLQAPAAIAAASPAPPPPPQEAPTFGQQAQQGRSQGTIQGQIGAQAQSFREEQLARDGERPRAAKAASGGGGFAGAPGLVGDYKGPLLQYSFAKRDTTGADSPLPAGARPQPGDAIRLTVLPGVAGYLSLYQFDPSGDWKRLFPAVEQGLLVGANARQTIPEAPIIVTTTEQKLRLMLVPVAAQQAAPAPLVVDITISPNK